MIKPGDKNVKLKHMLIVALSIVDVIKISINRQRSGAVQIILLGKHKFSNPVNTILMTSTIDNAMIIKMQVVGVYCFFVFI